MLRLTRTLVDCLKPADKEYTVWDSLLPGFGVRLRPGNPQKACYVQYRIPVRRQRYMGVYGILTVEEARSLAMHMKRSSDS
jgi:hypothetical protein